MSESYVRFQVPFLALVLWISEWVSHLLRQVCESYGEIRVTRGAWARKG